MKVHILDDWFDTLRTLPSFARLDGHEVTVWNDHCEDFSILAERLRPAQALVLFRERTPVAAPLLQHLPNLKLISQRGVYPHVDVAACSASKVLFCSNMQSGGPSVAAAELTIALMLASARQLPQQMKSLQSGNWQIGVGQTLRGRVLGLYGYGKIGGLVGQYAKAFGMNVIWWGSEAGRAKAAAAGEDVARSRAAFFGEADFVSLHNRLTPQTRGLITVDDLGLMKTSATFINTSRAGLVAKGALEQALAVGRPGRLALDVFDTEPLTDANDALVNHPAVIATPHIGFVTEDELDIQFGEIYDQINAYAAGKPINMINPDVHPLGHWGRP
ncbi:MAG: D-2-hydroxyacid dehydrogenase family protein [Rhodobacteraceae bacterium]|nr:D-2-hydroxyacid dehydrogenase family protein [Paracoccaceae bacterium]